MVRSGGLSPDRRKPQDQLGRQLGRPLTSAADPRPQKAKPGPEAEPNPHSSDDPERKVGQSAARHARACLASCCPEWAVNSVTEKPGRNRRGAQRYQYESNDGHANHRDQLPASAVTARLRSCSDACCCGMRCPKAWRHHICSATRWTNRPAHAMRSRENFSLHHELSCQA